MRLLIVFILLFLCVSGFAQDTLVKRDGSRILAKVLEVSTTEIKYKKAENPEGPVYLILKAELNSVVYSNGYKESCLDVIASLPKPVLAPVDLSIQINRRAYYYKERRISELDMLQIAQKQKDKKIDLMIRQVHDKKLIQTTALFSGMIIFTSGLYIYASNRPSRHGRRGSSPVNVAGRANARQNAGYLMLAGIGTELIAVTFKLERTRHAHMVVDLYNKSLLQ
jgi:hypothetical protein